MRVALAAAMLAVACVPSEGPLMEPGRDCLGCHGGGEAKRWTVAGTWPPQGSRVTVADAAGKSFTLKTNQVGNFYSAESLAFPLTVSVDGKAMPNPVTYGGCNLCHGPFGVQAGPLMLPGDDCLRCHDGTVAKRFTAAGTFLPAGSTVTISAGGSTVTVTTNQVGNFYTDQPLMLPGSTSVNGHLMQPALTYGGCNRCHGQGGAGEL
jgi:hypothetical protein